MNIGVISTECYKGRKVQTTSPLFNAIATYEHFDSNDDIIKSNFNNNDSNNNDNYVYS